MDKEINQELENQDENNVETPLAEEQNTETIDTETPKTAQTAPNPQKKKKKEKKKHGFFYKLLKAILIILLIILLPILGFLAYSALDSSASLEHIPEGHYAYVNLPSAGQFFQKMLALKTVDSFLASPDMASLQGQIRSLRMSPMISSPWFKIATNARVDIALYPGDNVLLISKLGFRSAATRLLPLALKWKEKEVSKIEELEIKTEKGVTLYTYKISDKQTFYVVCYKDSIIASSSKDLLFSALAGNSNEESIEIIEDFIADTESGSISVLADINYFKNGMKNDGSILYNCMKELNFDEGGIVNFNLTEDDALIKGQCKWDTQAEGLKAILENKPFVPAILNRLPKDVNYCTLLNLGDPKFLFENGKDVFGRDVINAYNSASKGSKMLLNKNVDELIFSWMGDEMGIFGIDQSDTPIFFTALKDENKCKETLDDIFSLVLVNQDVSAVVDGLRIPRIEFPNFLKRLLRAFGVNLPTPFYAIKDGFLYLSESAESLASMLNEVENGNLLIKTEKWKGLMDSISPESSIFVYYTLGEHVPAFLKNSKQIQAILKDYGKGIFTVNFSDEQNLLFDFYSQKTESKALSQIPEFPYNCNMKVSSDIYCAINDARIPFAYWTSRDSVYCLNLTDKSLNKVKLDDTAYMNLELDGEYIKSVWAVSARGTVYKMDYNLKAFDNFPILTGEHFEIKPIISNGEMIIPVGNKPVLLFAKSDGTVSYSNEMNKKLKQAPFVFEDYIAAIPRSFDSTMFVFDKEGKIIEDYETYLDSISAVQPILFTGSDGSTAYAVLTEDGTFSISPLEKTEKSEDEISEPAYKIELNTACRVQPVYSESLKKFFIISDKGFLYKIDNECRIVDKVSLKRKNAKDYKITLIDLDEDGRDDVLVSGGGNAIYAYTSNLDLYEGFPISGSGIPYYIDIDGDRVLDLITCGIDNKIYSYTGAFAK